MPIEDNTMLTIERPRCEVVLVCKLLCVNCIASIVYTFLPYKI